MRVRGRLTDVSGLTGSIGAIHANRLSTTLHTGLHPASLHPQPQRSRGLSPNENAWAMYAIAFPCQAAFLGFASWWGWIDFSLGWAGWLCFAVTVSLYPWIPDIRDEKIDEDDLG